LYVLIVEDRPDDAELLAYELERAGMAVRWQRVDSEAGYLACLLRAEDAPDVILADYSLPQFDALRALHLLQERGLDVPFIVVTATVGEEVVAECMRQGAADYLLKDRLGRLGLAVERALEAKRARDEQRRAQEARTELAREQAAREAAERMQRHLAVRDAVGTVLAEATLAAAPPRILEAICEGLGWDWSAFWEADERGGALRCVATWGRPSVGAAALDVASRHRAFAPGVGLPGRVWAGGRPVWVPDVRHDASFPRAKPAAQAGLRCALSVPVRSGGKVVGVIEVLSRAPRAEESDVLATMAGIGDKVGQFVERLRAEEALRESERRFRDLFDDAPVGYQELDAQGSVVRVNRTLCRMLGYEEAELLGRHIWDFEWAPGEPPQETRRKFLEKLRAGDAWASVERVRVRKDGTLLPVWVDDRLVRDEAGRVVGLRSAQMDVSARKRAEAERDRLLEAERAARAAAEEAQGAAALLAAIVRSSDDAIIGKTLDGVITSWNAGAERLYGYTAAEVVGRPIAVLVPPERRNEVPAILARLRRGERVEHYETVRVRKDGWRVDVSVTVSPVVDGAGRVVGASAIARDVTERRAAAAERERLLEAERAARAAAEAALRVRDEFLSIAAHDLRTPLTALSGYAQLLLGQLKREGQLEPERVGQALQTITDQAKKLARLLDRLLDVSRVEGDKLVLERHPTDLAGLVEQVVARARANTDRHAITLAVPASLEARVDPLRLEQVLTNLVDNAIKYSPDGGPIEVVLARPGDGGGAAVEMSVRDRGLGIPPEKRGQIFERFFQAHGNGHVRGLGLGLYISRQIVELHGGEIRAEFPPDGGTRFVVRLPLAPGEHDLPARPS
jgi:PAS domain S-box-containing protein